MSLRLFHLFFILIFTLLVFDGSLSADTTNKANEKLAQRSKNTDKKETESSQKNASTKKSNSSNNSNSNKTLKSWITPEREAAAQTFVRQHHPELEQLLISLKEHSEARYFVAIRDLFRTSERLAVTKEKNESLYEYQLNNWKLESRIKLLSAQLQMSPDNKQLQKELREILKQKIVHQKKNLRLEIERARARVNRLQDQFDRLEEKEENILEQQYKSITEGSTGKNRSNKSKSTTTSKTLPKNKASD